jgi:hypothetical protein
VVIWMEALNLAAGVVGVVRRPRSSPLNCSCLIFDPLIVKVIQFPDEQQNGIMHLIYLPRTSRANDGSLKYFLLSPAGLVDHLQSLDCTRGDICMRNKLCIRDLLNRSLKSLDTHIQACSSEMLSQVTLFLRRISEASIMYT